MGKRLVVSAAGKSEAGTGRGCLGDITLNHVPKETPDASACGGQSTF